MNIDLQSSPDVLQQAAKDFESIFRKASIDIDALLLDWANSRFRNLSTGVNVDGLSWRRRKESDDYRPLGVLTGRLLRSLKIVELPTRRNRKGGLFLRRSIRFTAPHAVFFDRLRRLLPKSLPRDVREKVDAIIQNAIAQFERRLRELGLAD